MPKAQLGTLRLKDTPTLRLNYSRDTLSSQSGDHYAANSGTPKSKVEVKVSRICEPDRIIEGSFSATALSTPDGQVKITRGRFRLQIVEEAPNKGPQGS